MNGFSKSDFVKIDTDFILNHYNSDKDKRPVILENHQRVVVEVPNLENLTLEFCNELNLFFNLICQNQIVADFLKKKSTVQIYFSPPENISSVSIDETESE
jgi:hypothetical protein